MDFSAIVNSVGQAWEFAWPPIILLLIMLVIVRLVAPRLFSVGISRLSSSQTLNAVRRIRAMFRIYGIGKLFPVAVAFSLILLLYMTTRIAMGAGNMIPVGVSYVPSLIIQKLLTHADIACYVKNLNDLQYISDITDFVSRQWRPAVDDDPSAKYWSRVSGRQVGMFNQVKFLLLLCLGFAILERVKFGPGVWGAPVALSFGLTLLCAYFATFHLYALEHEFRAVLSAATAGYRSQGACVIPTDKEELFQRLLRDAGRGSVGNDWWNVSFGFDHYVRWLWTEFFSRAR